MMKKPTSLRLDMQALENIKLSPCNQLTKDDPNSFRIKPKMHSAFTVLINSNWNKHGRIYMDLYGFI